MSSTTQRNFAGGEVAPAVYGRADLQKYATALRTLRNFICLRHGGVANRGGTEFCAPTKANGAIKFIDFVFSDNALPYVLEFGDRYMRVYQDGGQVIVAPAAWNIAFDYFIGDVVSEAGVNYYAIEGSLSVVPPDVAKWYPMPGGGIFEMPTPYLVADLPDVQFSQTADVITLAHRNYPTMTLSRFGNTSWVLAAETFSAGVDVPSGVAITSGTGVAAGTEVLGITSVDESGNESVPFTFGTTYDPTAGDITLTWSATPGAVRYNVYYSPLSVDTLGFYGATTGTTGIVFANPVPDYAHQPPVTRIPFLGAGTYPGVVSMYQQRRLLASTTSEPEKTWASRVGDYANFNISFPLQDDDAVTFSAAGRRVNEVRHLLDVGRLVILTSGGEFTAEGDQAGSLTPTAINLRQQLYHGAARVAPVVIGNVIIYVQARGSIIRDFMADLQQGYATGDLTIYAPHLFAGYTVLGLAFQQTPHSTLWVVRSDGVLLGLTYLREEDIWGWHRHDTDGAVENVCVVPEGDEDRLYLCVRRTIGGVTKRYVERMVSRTITPRTDPRDLVFMDAALSYDGRNTGATTMRLTGGAQWDNGESLTLTASAGVFSALDIGNAIFFTDAAGAVLVRVDLEGYTSPTVMTARAQATVPAALRAAPTVRWSRAVDTVAGLDHLEGKAVSILGDGTVVTTPYGPDAATVVVGGQVALGAPYAVVHVGLPYLSDFQTLDLDTPQGPSLKTSKLLATRVTLMVEQSAPCFAGIAPPRNDAVDALENLNRSIVRDESDDYGPLALRTGTFDVLLEGRYTDNGRVFVRMADPLPLTILAAMPQGTIPPAV